jgi:hypothetical protein
MRKLMRYTFAMFAAPWVTYRAVHDVVVPRLGGSIASFDALSESNNAIISGVAAVVAVNLVVAAYVASALAEENAFGRAASEEKRD